MVSGWNKRLGIFHEARIGASWPFAMRIFFDSLITPGYPRSSSTPAVFLSPRDGRQPIIPPALRCITYFHAANSLIILSRSSRGDRSIIIYEILPSSRPRNFHSHFRIIDDWSSYIISILDYSFFQSSSIDIIVIIIILYILYYILYTILYYYTISILDTCTRNLEKFLFIFRERREKGEGEDASTRIGNGKDAYVASPAHGNEIKTRPSLSLSNLSVYLSIYLSFSFSFGSIE